jgi:uncharacterized protein (TIGR03546 family)
MNSNPADNHCLVEGGPMFFLKILGRFFKALASHASPSGLAWGFALGAIPGLTPLGRLHNLAILACVMIFRINGSAALLSFGLYSLFAWMLDPLFHETGLALLNAKFLYPMWTALYNSPIAPLTGFNHTITLGSLVVALILLVPNYFLFRWAVRSYRTRWQPVVEKWKIVQILKGSRIVRIISKIRKLGG